MITYESICQKVGCDIIEFILNEPISDIEDDNETESQILTKKLSLEEIEFLSECAKDRSYLKREKRGNSNGNT